MAAIIGIDADILFVKKSTVDAETTQGGIDTFSIGAGGSSYNVDDVLTVTGGASQDVSATFLVTSETGNVVDGISRIDVGSGYAITDQGMATTVVPSGGTGCTIDADSIDSLVLPVWSTNDTEWTVLVNDSIYSWTQFPERNEFSISISVDIAEHKVFVEDPADAWVGKARLYMDWSGSMSGYLDTSNDEIFTNMKAGETIWAMFVNSKTNDIVDDDTTPDQYWLGQIILGSIDVSTPNEDFVTLDVDFSGNGELYRSEMPY